MYRIGVDLGGIGIKAGIVDENGKIVLKKSCKTEVDMGFYQIVEDMAGLINDLFDEADISVKEISSIGVGMPGASDSNGKVYYATNLKWVNVPLGEKLREYFPETEIYVDNDANATALAEYHFGAMQGVRSGVMITLGTGVGGGIILDGKLHQGAFHTGGELGHLIVGENFYSCNCGNNGCLETFCSATAIIKYAQKLMMDGKNSLIREKVQGQLDEVTAKMVFDAYRENDEVAVLVVNRFTKYLGIGISGLINLLDPELFVIGGGVAGAFELFIDELRKEVKRHVIFKEIPFANIVTARFQNDAGILGAAMLGK